MEQWHGFVPPPSQNMLLFLSMNALSSLLSVEMMAKGSPGAYIFGCSRQPGGRLVATACSDAKIRLWAIGPDGLLSFLHEVSPYLVLDREHVCDVSHPRRASMVPSAWICSSSVQASDLSLPLSSQVALSASSPAAPRTILTSCAFDQQGQHLACTSRDGTIFILVRVAQVPGVMDISRSLSRTHLAYLP